MYEIYIYIYLYLYTYVTILFCSNYFTSCDSHPDLSRCIWTYFHILWQFTWHTFWHSISIWHSIWHIFWHSVWHIFWHSMWHIPWHMFYHFLWHFICQIFWHSIWRFRSSDAHCDRTLAVEVQRCSPLSPLSSAGKKDWRETWRTGLGRHLAKRSGKEEEVARRRKRNEEEQTTLVKSNNPHLAGGEYFLIPFCFIHICFEEDTLMIGKWKMNESESNHHSLHRCVQTHHEGRSCSVRVWSCFVFRIPHKIPSSFVQHFLYTTKSNKILRKMATSVGEICLACRINVAAPLHAVLAGCHKGWIWFPKPLQEKKTFMYIYVVSYV